MIIRKLEKIVEKLNETINEIKIEENNPEILMENFNEKSQNFNIDLENILEDLYFTKKNLSIERAQKFFEAINKKENEMNFNINQMNKHKIKFYFNKKADEIFKKFDNLLDSYSYDKNLPPEENLKLNKFVDKISKENDHKSLEFLGDKNPLASASASKNLNIFGIKEINLEKVLSKNNSYFFSHKEKENEFKIKENSNLIDKDYKDFKEFKEGKELNKKRKIVKKNKQMSNKKSLDHIDIKKIDEALIEI